MSRRIPCPCRKGPRCATRPSGGSCNRQRLHAQARRGAADSRYSSGTSGYTDHSDLSIVSFRFVLRRRNCTDSRGTTSHRETALPYRSAGCGARYDWRTGLVHAGQFNVISKRLCLTRYGSIRFKRLQSRVIAVGGIVILAFAGSSAYDAWRSYRYSLAATNREITNVADALASQTAGTLQAVAQGNQLYGSRGSAYLAFVGRLQNHGFPTDPATQATGFRLLPRWD